MENKNGVKRRQWAYLLSMTEDEAVTYLLTRQAAIFKLQIKSHNMMYSDTKGSGSYGYRAVWQAGQRASIPIADRVGAPLDLRYKDNTDRLARITWVEGLVADLPPPANQDSLHAYIQWLRTSDVNPPNFHLRESSDGW